MIRLEPNNILLTKELIEGVLNTTDFSITGKFLISKLGEETSELSTAIHRVNYAFRNGMIPRLEHWDNLKKEIADVLITIIMYSYSVDFIGDIHKYIQDEILRWSS